jgi:hypothetical protein
MEESRLEATVVERVDVRRRHDQIPVPINQLRSGQMSAKPGRQFASARRAAITHTLQYGERCRGLAVNDDLDRMRQPVENVSPAGPGGAPRMGTRRFEMMVATL